MFYVQVGKNTQEKENMTVVPKVDSSSVAEIGYVFEARNEIDYSDRIRKEKLTTLTLAMAFAPNNGRVTGSSRKSRAGSRPFCSG
jgi:hypothetical protein